MHERSPRTPYTPQDVMSYLQRLQLTDEHLVARQTEYERQRRHQQGKRLAHHTLQNVMAHTAEALGRNTGSRERADFDPALNEIIKTLPDFRDGQIALDRHRGDARSNKRKVIPFNHALKGYIDHHSSLGPVAFRSIIGSTMQGLHYSPALIETVHDDIIPGMEHELALEENLYYLPGQPLVLEAGMSEDDLDDTHDPAMMQRLIDAELKGCDYLLVYPDDITLTIDVKKSEQSALRAQDEREVWRKIHHITEPDDHLIIWTGYTERDFLPHKIGRVTPEAREREQSRIDEVVRQRYIRLRQAKASLTNRQKYSSIA